jgi:hypothetical protein
MTIAMNAGDGKCDAVEFIRHVNAVNLKASTVITKILLKR